MYWSSISSTYDQRLKTATCIVGSLMNPEINEGETPYQYYRKDFVTLRGSFNLIVGSGKSYQAIYDNENCVIHGEPKKEQKAAREDLELIIHQINADFDVPSYIRKGLPKKIIS